MSLDKAVVEQAIRKIDGSLPGTSTWVIGSDVMDKIRGTVTRMAKAKASQDENAIRELLGRWVSEFEPSVAYQNGDVIGLCVADDPSGSVPVRVR
jgi:hypothetical protein